MRDHRKQGTNLVSNSYYFFGIVNIIIEEGGLAPFGGIGYATPAYPRWAREITVDTTFDYWGAVFTYVNTRAPRPNNQAAV